MAEKGRDGVGLAVWLSAPGMVWRKGGQGQGTSWRSEASGGKVRVGATPSQPTVSLRLQEHVNIPLKNSGCFTDFTVSTPKLRGRVFLARATQALDVKSSSFFFFVK